MQRLGCPPAELVVCSALKRILSFRRCRQKTITEEKKSHREVKGARSTKKKNFHRDVIFSAPCRDFISVVVRQKKGSLGAFSCMTGSLTLNGSHLVNRLSETGGSHESRLFSSDPEWVEPVDALYGSTPLGS